MTRYFPQENSGAANRIWHTDSGSLLVPLCSPSSAREDCINIIQGQELEFPKAAAPEKQEEQSHKALKVL
ncbi:MAG: hypothetical protein NTX50_13830 [Candidatus Sumerlaeota bacterium]|nr:hypothetical protein [Candidatus Sumerlaeota bacterium]